MVASPVQQLQCHVCIVEFHPARAVQAHQAYAPLNHVKRVAVSGVWGQKSEMLTSSYLWCRTGWGTLLPWRAPRVWPWLCNELVPAELSQQQNVSVQGNLTPSSVNFCNISAYLSSDSIISTFFFCLSFPEVIILQHRSILLLKPAMLTYFIYSSYREDRWKTEFQSSHYCCSTAVFCSGTSGPILVLCCSPINTLFWTRNSRAHVGFMFLYWNPLLSPVPGHFLYFREISPGLGVLPYIAWGNICGWGHEVQSLNVVLPKPWAATFPFPPITTVLLNKMSFSWLSFSVSSPYPVTLASTGELQRLFLCCPQLFPPLVYLFGFFFLSFFSSEILRRWRFFASVSQFEA